MTVTSALSPLSLTCFFYDSGELVRPARLFFYKPNTEDAVTVYTDPTLGVPYGQPVLSGASGRVPPIYIGTEPYRVRIYDTYGALVEDIEFLPGAAASSGGGGGGDPIADGAVLQSGDMFFAFASATTQRDGCVRANGGIIGSVGFDVAPYPGQIERLNADTHDLFVWLWGQDIAAVSALAVVPSGRGSSAESDWLLNKGIRLPDLRGRTLVGIDAMGQAATGRLNGVTTTPAVYEWSGGVGGFATTTQSQAQIAAHAHSMTANSTGVTVIANGTSITVNDPGHDHTYPAPDLAELMEEAGSAAIASAGGEAPTGPLVPSLFLQATNPSVTGISLNDGGHYHGIADPTHSHTVSANGSGQAMQTISPFSLAVVYIKL